MENKAEKTIMQFIADNQTIIPNRQFLSYFPFRMEMKIKAPVSRNMFATIIKK